MIRIIALLFITTGMMACMSRITHSTEAPSDPITMVSTNGLVIGDVRLQARDERIQPPGTRVESDRDRGFATVFMDLENHVESTIELTIEQIEIRNTANDQVQLATVAPEVIVLRPLEHAKPAFQLTNTSGYSRHDEVKAVIRYRVNNQTGTLESTPVEVDR